MLLLVSVISGCNFDLQSKISSFKKIEPTDPPPTNPPPAPEESTMESIEITPEPVETAPGPNSPATTIIQTSNLGDFQMNSYFQSTKISDDIYQRIYRKSYKENSTISLDDLRYLKVLYYGFDDKTHIGELMVNTAISDNVLAIFKELYIAKYPIEKMVLVDEYNADDDASMSDNNSSSFNYRYVDGSTTMSKHSLGLAIDINPLYNPYVRSSKGDRNILPKEGAVYVDRTLDCPYMIQKDDICYQIFLKYGFTWGGDWTSSKDYQHFQVELD